MTLWMVSYFFSFLWTFSWKTRGVKIMNKYFAFIWKPAKSELILTTYYLDRTPVALNSHRHVFSSCPFDVSKAKLNCSFSHSLTPKSLSLWSMAPLAAQLEILNRNPSIFLTSHLMIFVVVVVLWTFPPNCYPTLCLPTPPHPHYQARCAH